LEEFAKYRNNKKLQESWSARFNQERRIQRAHDRLVAAESLNVKTQLLKLVEGVMSMDKDDHDTGGFRIPNKKAKEAKERVEKKTAQKMMKKMDPYKEEVETITEKGPAVGGKRPPGYLAKRREEIEAAERKAAERKAANERPAANQGVNNEEVSQIRKSWGDAYRSIYADKETISEKGMNPGFKAYLEKQKANKGEGDDEGKSSKGGGKPDFLDLDKDGDKKEPMKKASKEMKKEEVESVDEAMRPGERQRKVAAKRHDPYATSRDRATAHNVAVRNDGPGTPGYEKKSTGGKGPRYAGYGDQGAGNKARRRAGEQPIRGNRDPRKMGEGVQFSEAELKAFEEIVNSWED
jgi:hypothetical protein